MTGAKPHRRTITADVGSAVMGAPAISGTLWSLPGSRDFQASLIQLQPEQVLPSPQPTPRRDTIVFVVTGEGVLEVEEEDQEPHHLEPSVFVHVPGGARRAVHAGRQPLAFLLLQCREDAPRPHEDDGAVS